MQPLLLTMLTTKECPWTQCELWRLPTQLALHRAGLQIEQVWRYKADNWWPIVRMSEEMEAIWHSYYRDRGFERSQELTSTQVLLAPGHAITDYVGLDMDTLEELIRRIPPYRINREKHEQEWDALCHAIWELPEQQHEWSTYRTTEPVHDELQDYCQYYCYEIWHHQRPLYVGKGKGSRCAQHLKRSELIAFDQLCIKIFRHESEAMALHDERRRVEQYGLHNLLNKVMPPGSRGIA